MIQTISRYDDPQHEDQREDVAVTARAVTKRYGDRPVLDGLSFEVRRGEIFGILGPNGAGKTTTVEILQGLTHADSGEIRVLGIDPRVDQGDLRRLVGSQLQSSALPDQLRVGEAVRLFTTLAGDVTDWRTLLAEWDLLRLERSPFRALSGGERQRLFLALALVNRPRLVFLDELTQGLDPAARRETWRLIERVRDEGTTVVLVSHYMDEVEHLCDRIGVLAHGRLDVVGTPTELVAAHGGFVRTSFRHAGPSLAAALSGLAGVARTGVVGTRHVVEGDAESPLRVAALLADLDVRPPDFTVGRPSLEDVLVSMTEGAAR